MKIQPGMIVRIRDFTTAMWHRVDGTGSGWQIRNGSTAYVVEPAVNALGDYWKIDDRDRPELNGVPAFQATVHESEIVPLPLLYQLAAQAIDEPPPETPEP